MTDRPKVCPGAFALINIKCRVCDEMLECYVLEPGQSIYGLELPMVGEHEATLYDAALLTANVMQIHLIDEHDYPETLFGPPTLTQKEPS